MTGTPGTQCSGSTHNCVSGPPSVACRLGCDECYLGGYGGFLGQLQVVSIGARASAQFEGADAEKYKGMVVFFGGIQLEQAGPLELLGACPHGDFIKKIDGHPASEMLFRKLLDNLEQGFEIGGSLAFVCPHRMDRWTADYKIIIPALEKAPDAGEIKK